MATMRSTLRSTLPGLPEDAGGSAASILSDDAQTDPSLPAQQVSHTSADDSVDTSKFDTMVDISDKNGKITFRTLWTSFKKTLGQGDLAGFQMIWGVMSLVFFICKLSKVSIFDNIEWWTIFVLPISNLILTGVFDYLIAKYRNPRGIESLIRIAFAFLFCFKLFNGLTILYWWLYDRNGGFIDRYSSDSDWKESFCQCEVACVFSACILAVIVSELIITTNIINSEQNLFYDTPLSTRIALFFIRPIVWVYNRAMIMFLTFYIFYGTIYLIFAVGLVCDLGCEHEKCETDLQSVGISFLLLPFSSPLYLFTIKNVEILFSSFNNIENNDLTKEIVLTFLVTSFYVDVLNGIIQMVYRLFLRKCLNNYCGFHLSDSDSNNNNNNNDNNNSSKETSSQTELKVKRKSKSKSKSKTKDKASEKFGTFTTQLRLAREKRSEKELVRQLSSTLNTNTNTNGEKNISRHIDIGNNSGKINDNEIDENDENEATVTPIVGGQVGDRNYSIKDDDSKNIQELSKQLREISMESKSKDGNYVTPLAIIEDTNDGTQGQEASSMQFDTRDLADAIKAADIAFGSQAIQESTDGNEANDNSVSTTTKSLQINNNNVNQDNEDDDKATPLLPIISKTTNKTNLKMNKTNSTQL